MGRFSIIPYFLYVHTLNTCRDNTIVVMGRVRYSFGSGFWDEWFLEFNDGTIGWLTEDNHELALQTRTTSKKTPPGDYRNLPGD
jgi:hypothetical protein